MALMRAVRDVAAPSQGKGIVALRSENCRLFDFYVCFL